MPTHPVPGSPATSEPPPVPIRGAGFEDAVPEVRSSGPRARLPRPGPAAAMPAGGNPAP